MKLILKKLITYDPNEIRKNLLWSVSDSGLSTIKTIKQPKLTVADKEINNIEPEQKVLLLSSRSKNIP